MYKLFSRLPTALAVEILEDLYTFVNEAGVNQQDISGELAKTIALIKEQDYSSYIADLVEIGKEALPKNYLYIVQKDLAEKGYTFSRKYISSVLSMRYQKWNSIIFDSFVSVLKAENIKNNQSIADLIQAVQ